MNEQLEKINLQAQQLVEEIEKYRSASSINKESAEGFRRVADSLKMVAEKIRPLTGTGFLRLQYIAIGLSIVNLVAIGVLAFLFIK